MSRLARVLGVPKTSAFRSLETLRYAGWARVSEDCQSAWSLTAKALAVGMNAAPGEDLVELAVKEMSLIRDEIRETMHLLAMEQDRQLIIARADGTNALRTFLSLGTRVPFHSTASGRAILSGMPEQEIVRLLDLEAEEGPFNRVEVLREVDKARERGYAENFTEWRTDIAAIAVPEASRRGEPMAALSASMPYTNVAAADRQAIGRMLIEAAERISQSMVR